MYMLHVFFKKCYETSQPLLKIFTYQMGKQAIGMLCWWGRWKQGLHVPTRIHVIDLTGFEVSINSRSVSYMEIATGPVIRIWFQHSLSDFTYPTWILAVFTVAFTTILTTIPNHFFSFPSMGLSKLLQVTVKRGIFVTIFSLYEFPQEDCVPKEGFVT